MNMSVETCTVMNVLGYWPHIRKVRTEAYKARDRHMAAQAGGNVTQITKSSKAEDLISYLENDTD